MAHQFDLFLTKARRESGSLASVSDWVADGLIVAERFLPYGELMGEDFKRLPIARPRDPSWWGILVRNAVRAKIISPTDRFAPADSAANHGHHYRVYLRGRM